RVARKDVRERVDVDVLENALASRLLQPHDELRAEDVDLAVEDPPAGRDLLLLARQPVDQILQRVVGEADEILKRLHHCPFVRKPGLKLRLRFYLTVALSRAFM